MPVWAYHIPPLLLALLMVAGIEAASLVGLFLVRRRVLPHIRFHDGVNDGVSGVVAAIGVFYGITAGLIAVGVWNTYTSSADLVSKEAAAIGTLYHDVSGYPGPARDKLQAGLREYTRAVIEQIWPAQKQGRVVNIGRRVLDDFQATLHAFEPSTAGQVALHTEALQAYNKLIEYRRLRIDAVNSGLSPLMWAVIWVGAAISISVAYFYNFEDPKLHFILVALMAGFLAIVLFMIVINDKPFFGHVSLEPDSYTLILQRVIDPAR